MKELKIIATVTVKPEFVAEVKESLTKVVDGTRTESGNISYVLHIDTKNPLKYVIIEHWKNQDAIDSHNQTAHFQNFVAEIQDKVEGLDVAIIEECY